MKINGMKEFQRLSRRDFIKISTNALLGLGGVLGLAGLFRYFSFQPDPGTPKEWDLGDPAAFPIGSRTERRDIPAVIYNRDGKIVAFSLTCTHLGCTVDDDDKEFSCPCHGSRFDQDGQVIEGPAQKALNPLRVEISEGNILRIHID